MSQKAQKDQDGSDRKIKLKIKDLGKMQHGSAHIGLLKYVKVNPNFSRSKLVETINHEYRHQWQGKIMDEFKPIKVFIKKLLKIDVF